MDEGEKEGVLDRIQAEKRGKVNVQRFKVRRDEPHTASRPLDPNTRRLVQLTVDDTPKTVELMDMLLAKDLATGKVGGQGNLAMV